MFPDRYPGEFLRVDSGSKLYGTNTQDSDTDLMGVCVEPDSTVYGVGQFEQWVYRSADDGERSESGDVDLTVYGLKKWVSLALKGNPTVLSILYAPDECIRLMEGRFSVELLGMRDAIVSVKCRDRFLGYLHGQRKRALEGSPSGKARREGRETKWASHMVRLAFQAYELVGTGWLSLPMRGWQTEYCRAVRDGLIPLGDVLGYVAMLEREIRDMVSPLPSEPDTGRVEAWMKSVYLRSALGGVGCLRCRC